MQQLNSKILLFGEYALLHEGMALVIPCDLYNGRLDFYEASDASDKKYALQSNEYLKRFCEFVAEHTNEKFVLEVKQFEKELQEGLFFRSTIPQGYGLGSSGALVAAIFLRYLRKAKNVKDELKYVTYQTLQELKSNLGRLESFFHGVSSGLDPLSIVLNEPILYKNRDEIITAKMPVRNESDDNVVFLLDTKHPRSTSVMMKRFNNLMQDKEFKKKFGEYIIHDNNKAIESFLNNDLDSFYTSMHDLSFFQLLEMKEFFPESFRKDVAAGLENGDYFLKLCGAGGGGFMLGFTKDWKTTQKKLQEYTLEKIYSY